MSESTCSLVHAVAESGGTGLYGGSHMQGGCSLYALIYAGQAPVGVMLEELDVMHGDANMVECAAGSC